MSGAVGSMPSFTRSGRPSRSAVRSFARERAHGQAVDGARGQLRGQPSACFVGDPVGGVRHRWPMLDSRRPEGPTAPRRARPAPPGPGAPRTPEDPPPPPPMSDDDRPDIRRSPTRDRPMEARSTGSPTANGRSIAARRGTRLKRLRFVAILFAVLLLGLVSFVFGMFVSVASDLPSLTRFSQYKNEKSSILYDDLGHPIGVLSQQNRVIVTAEQIPADRQGRGDLDRGQALLDQQRRRPPRHRARVRRRHRAQRRRPGRLDDRGAVHQERAPGAVAPHDLREAPRGRARLSALAQVVEGKDHHRLPQHDLLRQRRLRDRGRRRRPTSATKSTTLGCGTPGHSCASSSSSRGRRRCSRASSSRRPSTTPPTHPVAAKERRDVVLRQMLDQGYLTRPVYEESVRQALPSPAEIQAPQEQTVEGVDAGYFTSWVQQQVIERYGAQRAFDGGLKIKTTLDLELQRAAEQAVNRLPLRPRRPDRLAGRDRKLDRRGARDGRAGATTTKARSTSPPRASASRAPRSRRSTSPPRSSTASRPTRCGPRRKRTSSSTDRTASKSSSCTTTKAPTRARTR